MLSHKHICTIEENQSNRGIENTDVSFVKGANERNEFFEKINKQ